MRKFKIIILGLLSVITTGSLSAGKWTTHFAYNNVTQIAMSPDKVYAISDGNLFSVDKTSEEIAIYNRQSGLHGSGITCIHYDESGAQLIICYGSGKVDIMRGSGVQYVNGLYDKDMTQRKTIYNITIEGRTAYLATHYGVQTMDLRENKMVDSYWLRPGGLETPVEDILLANDSIYAFGKDSLFCASRDANLVDYRVWRRELRSGRIAPDADKGTHYQDATSHWYRSYGEGIVRFTATERLSYKPEGPLVNIPYRITAKQGKVWVVPGGRWSSQNSYPGHVMRYDGMHWKTITADTTYAKTHSAVLDFMNVAVDPTNLEHYYVTSYGTGLYEFDHDTLVRHDLAGGDNTLVSAAATAPDRYTRLDFASYDSLGNLWFLNAGRSSQRQCVRASGEWSAQDLVIDGVNFQVETPGGLIIDQQRPNHKWISTARYNTMLCLIDENGTPWDNSDDRIKSRSQWTDQQGRSLTPGFIFQMLQDSQGRVWIATDFGAAYIAPETDFFTSDAIVRPVVTDENGDNPIQEQRISAISESADGDIWIGTEDLGIYVLNSTCTEIIAHYTTDNSAMPSNTILSLAGDDEGTIWIGTSEGLVAYAPGEEGEGITGVRQKGESSLDPGEMKQWKLHFSYSNVKEVAASPNHLYALTQGALFSVDRTDETTTRWSKATGLNGSTIAHIAYDSRSGKLIIGYEDGRVDLVSDDGTVEQMPDIFMKAGSIAVTINSIYTGSKYTYLAMPFGIVAIDPGKGEVIDTYYIGNEAAAIDIQQIVEMGDSLYAFSYGRLYRAAKKDNLVDFKYWKSSVLPFEKVQQVSVHNGSMYALEDSTLYRRKGNTWLTVSSRKLQWIHVSGNRFLAYEQGAGLLQMDENEQFPVLTDRYAANDAVYTNGEYWLGEDENGLVRLGKEGDSYFRSEGPINNYGYKLQIAHNQVYVSPGGRWAEQYGRQSSLNIYDGQTWRGIPWSDTWFYTSHDIRDVVSYAVDAKDPGHFYVATYGTGVFEFKDYRAINHFDSVNSTLRRATPNVGDYYFTRTDGAMMDDQGNLWVLNATSLGLPLHILTPSGQWYGLKMRSGGTDIQFNTPGGILTDRRDSRYKWITDQRVSTGVIFYYDNGTPTVNSDDRCLKRNIFVDQNGNTVSPTFIYSLTQDRKNRIWIGTEKGIILIPSETDFFTSNACRRIIIPRNDGTGLGDYLLGEEQVRCMAADGGNRMWIGTASSGLYVIEDDTITVAHFTENNSLLPSNSIQSIAIMPSTGEVFVGTDKGIASYLADASEPVKNMSKAYAYPNPVRPDYGGYITIAGLVENTTVNIVDAGGNLVCKTKSQGGTAVWDGKLPDGRRATAGVYTALCNANGGKAVVKILVIR